MGGIDFLMTGTVSMPHAENGIPMAELAAPFPNAPISLFAEVLSKEANWYNLSVFLGAPTHVLDPLQSNYGKENIMRLYIEVYKYFQYREEPLTWEYIAISLRRMGNDCLAQEIDVRFVKPAKECIPSNGADRNIFVEIRSPILDKIAEDFEYLSDKLITLLLKTKLAFKKSDVNIADLQDLVEDKCGRSVVPPLPIVSHSPTKQFDVIFDGLKKNCSILNFRALIFIVKNLLKDDRALRRQLANFEKKVDKDFKSSVRMREFVGLIKEKKIISNDDQIMKLKVKTFWNEFTIEQFETVAGEVLHTLYDVTSQIRVNKGCICISGVIPEHIDVTKLVSASSPEESEFAKDIGVSLLHIDTPSRIARSRPIEIYKFEMIGKSPTFEEALSQCKSPRARERLEIIGECSYNTSNKYCNLFFLPQKIY